jgi:hypothetical protein
LFSFPLLAGEKNETFERRKEKTVPDQVLQLLGHEQKMITRPTDRNGDNLLELVVIVIVDVIVVELLL